MGDLDYIDRDTEVKIVGQDSTGLRVNYVGADTHGNLNVIDYSNGSVTGGTAATVSSLIGGQFNTVLPTLTNGQQSAIQLDSSGRIIIRPLTSSDSVSAVQSGTWTIQPGNTANTIPWLVTDSSDGSVIPGTAANKASLVAGQYSSTLPVATTGQQVAIQVDQNGRLLTSSVALPTTASKFSFGEITTTSTAANQAVDSTVYTETTTNSTMTIVSSSTNDTSAGTGARTVVVTYLDQAGDGPFTTTFTMNGTGVVTAGVSNMCFIEKIVVSTVGSTGSNVGTLTLKTGGAVTVGTVTPTINRTLWAHHYVPTSKTCYISGFSFGNNATATGNGGELTLKSSTPTVANTPEIQVSDFCTVAGGVSTVTRNYNSPIQVVGPARIKAYVTPYNGANTIHFASFDFIDN